MTFLIYSLPENGEQTWRELAAGAIVDVIDWEYEKLFCGVGTFELTVPIKADDVDKLKLNRLLVSDEGGFIIKQLEYGSENVVISGYDLNGMLLDRLTVAKTDDGKDKISGSTETIVKHFVDVNCVSSPDAGRNLPGLYIAADEGRGNPNDAASPRLECVADVISDILSAQQMGWEITIGTYAYSPGESSDTAPMRFCFEVLKAVDDTWTGQNKGAVTFSYGHGNANSLKTEKSIAGAKNTLYCELDSGMVQTYSPIINNVGFERAEEYANLGCELSELSVYAAHEIAGRFNSVENVTIEHIDPSTYAPLGHIVTVVDKNANTKLEALITAKKVRHSGDTHEITLTIGEARTKVIDRVSKSVSAVSSGVKNGSGSIVCSSANSKITIVPSAYSPPPELITSENQAVVSVQNGVLNVRTPQAYVNLAGGYVYVETYSQSGINHFEINAYGITHIRNGKTMFSITDMSDGSGNTDGGTICLGNQRIEVLNGTMRVNGNVVKFE